MDDRGADECLIEKVEKNPQKPPNCSVFMFRVGIASMTAITGLIL